MTFDDFDKIYRSCAAEDLSKLRSWCYCFPKIYRPSMHLRPALQHGPKTFRWWLPIVVHIRAARSWGVQWRGYWNVWIYTRWNVNVNIGVRGCARLIES